MMRTQYYPHPFHRQDVYQLQNQYFGQPTSSNFLSPTGLDLSSFSRGSSLSYPEYQLPTADRGDSAGLAGPASSLPGSSLCATGLGISGQSVSASNGFQAEAIMDFPLQQHWQWSASSEPLHGLPLPSVPHPHAPLSEHEFSTIKSSPNYDIESSVLSPAAQRPTPASMAVLLNQTTRSEAKNSPQISFRSPPDGSHTTQPPSTSTTKHVEGPQTPSEPIPHHEDSLIRERKHACTMCHKRFDRPSTLKKHFLVHTGEKAYVCETCGRRFGVPSNLNRHVRRCVLKPVNATSAAGNAEHANNAGGSSTNASATPPSPSHTLSSDSSDKAGSPGRISYPHSHHNKAPGAPKRRRRAPSPSRWVPPSLAHFNLAPPESKKSTAVPLPPVRRSLPREERDSWDENVSTTPYHPRGWKNVLPGPGLGLGLGGKDVRNLNLGGNGGYMLGRVLVLDLVPDGERR